MTAASDDVNTVDAGIYKKVELQLAASQTIYQGTMVCRNASGKAVPAADTAGLKLAGVSQGDERTGVSTQTSAATGTYYVQVYRSGVYKFAASGLAITDIGKRVYVSDDKTITKTPTNVFAGYLVGIDGASWGFVDIGEATHNDDADAADESFIDLPVAASTTIVVDTHVATDDGGYLVPANDASAVKYAGVAREGVANAGADGAVNCMVQQDGVVLCTAASLLPIDVLKPVFVNTAAALTKTSTDQSLFAGIVLKYVSATSAYVDIGAGVSGKCPDTVFVGIAASKTVTAGEGVCLDADGYLVAMDDSTAISFWGICQNTVANAGADGTVGAWVRRAGIVELTSSSLAAADVGKECWQATDGVTVTKTPGNILVGIIDEVISATVAVVRYKPMPIVGQRADRQFTIPFAHTGSSLNGKSAFTDRQHPKRYICLQMQFDVETSPGGTDALTCTLTDGTTTFAATATEPAVHGELLTPQVPTTATMLTTDTDLTLTDTGTTTANVKGEVLCEAL